MATFPQSLSLFILALQLHHLFTGEAKTLTVTNNCNYTIWPCISANNLGSISNDDSGFTLQQGESRVVPVQTEWVGRVWGRTLCSSNKSTGNFSCKTGDCGTGSIQCGTAKPFNYQHPATVAEFSFGLFAIGDGYDVSVIGGYNLPLLVEPHVDSNSTCEITGCVFDLGESCLAELQVVGNNGNIVGCMSPCDVFKTDEFCCNDGTDCKRSNFSLSSLIFKKPCPRAFSYAVDEEADTFYCDSSSSYNITFCPSPTISRLLSVPVSPSPLISELPGNSGNGKSHTSLIVAISIIAAALVLMFLCIFVCIYRKKAIDRSTVQTDEMKRFVDSLQFDFNTIRTATHNFAADNKLGEGGFGAVYKGELEDGQEIAVKRLSKNSGQGIAEFETEIILVAKLQHKNLVKLLGYYASPKESLLIYEFLPNLSLDKFLFDSAKKASLDWQTRFMIVIGIARGLLYLHEDSRIKVVHRDLKSSNILLDEAMNPKIADFGLARLFGVDQTQGDTNRIVGTYGYMAPEYAITGHYSVKSDVYSFGVIVLEIVSGQRNRVFGRVQLEEALLHRAWRLWNEDAALNLVDTELEGSFAREEVLKCIQMGLLCIQENAIDRPRMASLVAALTGQAISLPTPKPPHFFGRTANDEGQDLAYTGAETITDVYSRE